MKSRKLDNYVNIGIVPKELISFLREAYEDREIVYYVDWKYRFFSFERAAAENWEQYGVNDEEVEEICKDIDDYVNNAFYGYPKNINDDDK